MKRWSTRRSTALLPHPFTALIDAFLQQLNSKGVKPPREVSGRGGVRNTLGAQRIQEHLVIASQLDVFQPYAPEQNIVGNVQHMVGFMVGGILDDEDDDSLGF
jgi:hypothetical protein